jgi:hypothetical protein
MVGQKKKQVNHETQKSTTIIPYYSYHIRAYSVHALPSSSAHRYNSLPVSWKEGLDFSTDRGAQLRPRLGLVSTAASKTRVPSKTLAMIR